jgi:hypothetical protein
VKGKSGVDCNSHFGFCPGLEGEKALSSLLYDRDMPWPCVKQVGRFRLQSEK